MTGATYNIKMDGVDLGTVRYLTNGAGVGIYAGELRLADTPYATPVYYDNFSMTLTANADFVNLTSFAPIAQNWLNTYDAAFYESKALGTTPGDFLPGYYVATIKAYNSTDGHFGRLGMYTFNANGTVTNKFWQWNFMQSNEDVSPSDRQIGPLAQLPEPSGWDPCSTDEPLYLYSHTTFLTGESAMTTLTGSYTRNGCDAIINYSNGTWEKWYQTWEETGNLYKMELYDASYIKPGTLCAISKSGSTWGRNPLISTGSGASTTLNVRNTGWMFGSSRDFTYAAPVTANAPLFLYTNMEGESLEFNRDLGDVFGKGIYGAAGYFKAADWRWTTNGVLKNEWYDRQPGIGEWWVYQYISTPVSNPGIMARRVMYKTGHVAAGVHNAETLNGWGHLHCGLQIIDNKGNFRGCVLIQYNKQPILPIRASGLPASTGLTTLPIRPK